MNAWEQLIADKKKCRARTAQIHVLREDRKATFDEPDGETGDTEVIEPDGTHSDG